MSKEYLENYSPSDEELSLDYDFGGPKIRFTDLESFRPRFGFDYISLDYSNLCFNNPKLEANDFAKFFEVVCKMSWETYSDIYDAEKEGYRFHIVELDHPDRRHLIPKFEESINDYCGEQISIMPDFFQFEVYTYLKKAARIVGFIGKAGIFYPVWFDSDHSIYQDH